MYEIYKMFSSKMDQFKTTSKQRWLKFLLQIQPKIL
jgi:hypothetical protein